MSVTSREQLDAARAAAGREPRRKTPTERQHEALIAALTKPTVEARERCGVSRDRFGYHFDIGGVREDAESLRDLAERVTEVATTLDAQFPYRPTADAEVSRNAKGDHQWSASGDPDTVSGLAPRLDREWPRSRAQAYDREMPDEEAIAAAKAKRDRTTAGKAAKGGA